MNTGQTIEDSILDYLQHLLSFDIVSQNDFLLTKFDPQSLYIEVGQLARENGLRPYLQVSPNMNDLNIELLKKVLIDHNNSLWLFDTFYQMLTPIFQKDRRKIQVRLSQANLIDFDEKLKEIAGQMFLSVERVENLADKQQVKLYLTLGSEEEAKKIFHYLLSIQTEVGIQIKMEEVNYVEAFQQKIIQRQSQPPPLKKRYFRYQQQWDPSFPPQQPQNQDFSNQQQYIPQFEQQQFQPQQQEMFQQHSFNPNQFPQMQQQFIPPYNQPFFQPQQLYIPPQVPQQPPQPIHQQQSTSSDTPEVVDPQRLSNDNDDQDNSNGSSPDQYQDKSRPDNYRYDRGRGNYRGSRGRGTYNNRGNGNNRGGYRNNDYRKNNYQGGSFQQKQNRGVEFNFPSRGSTQKGGYKGPQTQYVEVKKEG